MQTLFWLTDSQWDEVKLVLEPKGAQAKASTTGGGQRPCLPAGKWLQVGPVTARVRPL